MDFNYSVTQDYWLIFKQGEGAWFQKFLKKGFGHVLVLTRDKYNWIVLDPHRLKLNAVIPPYQVTENVPRLMVNDGYRVVKVTMFERSTFQTGGHSVFSTCVSFVKYCLGLKLFCVTPYGLYKRLLRLNSTTQKRNGIRQVQLII